jgi:hypothetical protein
MSEISAFNPQGSTVLVGTSAVQVPGASSPGGSSGGFRVRCLISGYLTWGQTSGVTAAGAPSGGSPVAATVGMSAGATETFKLPPQSYFISNVAASFEITPGEGV